MTDTFDYGAAAGKKDEQQDVPVFTPDISTPDPKPVATSFDFEAAAGRRTKPPAVEDGKPFREITDPRGGPRVNQPEPPQWSAFGTPLPGTKAAEQGLEIHPLSRAVLQNFDLTDDISGNSAALRKIVRRVDEKSNPRSRLPVEELTDDQLTKIVEQPRMQRALQIDSITRRRMAEDAEEAAILRGEIPFMLAAEGSVDTMVRMMRPPETRTPEAIAAQQNRGFLDSAANAIQRGIDRPRFGLLISFAQSKAARGRAASGNPLQTFSDAFKEGAFGAEGSIQRKVTTIPNPIDLLYGLGQGIGAIGDVYLSGGYNEATASRLEKEAYAELEDAFRSLKRAEATTPMSRPATRFMRGFQELPDDPVGALTGFLSLLIDDPAGFTAASSEVLAEQTPILAASAVVRKPLGGVAAISTNALGTYVSERFNVDAQRIALVKKRTGIDLNTAKGRADFLVNAEAQEVFSAYGRTRGAIIATGVGVGGAYFRSGTLVPMKSLTGRFAEQTLVSGVLDGSFEAAAGLATTGKIDVKEAIAEAAFGTNPVSVAIESTLSGRADYVRLNDSKKAKAWLEGSTEIKGDIAGIPVVKLDTAASVMGEKLESEGIETVYITASDLYTFDQDGEVAETLGLNPEDVARAAAEGGTVEVSASTFVRHILGKDGFDALLEHTMFDPTGMTPAEARQYDEAGIGDQIQQQIEERVRSNLAPGLDESSLTKLNTDMSTIQDQVAGQLEATGRYDANKSRLFGLLTAQRYATRAIRIAEETGQPVDASALFASDNLRIQGGQPTPVAFKQGGFEAYRKLVDPEGRTIPAEDRPNLRMGDMYGMLPKDAEVVGELDDVILHRGANGDYYATAYNADLGEQDVVGFIQGRENGTELAVVEEMQGKGIGSELQYLFRRENPLAPTGGLTEAGASRLESTYDRLAAEYMDPLEQSAKEFGVSTEVLQAELAEAGGDITQTPRFKEWFKQSAVVDENGQPLTVYHGTPEVFDAFITQRQGSRRVDQFGAFFSDSPDFALAYSVRGVPGGESNVGQVMPVYLSLQNPWVVEGDAGFDRLIEIVREKAGERGRPNRMPEEGFDMAALREYFQLSGVDGIIIKNFDGDRLDGAMDDGYGGKIATPTSQTVYIALDPNQIKSVFNRGAFDPADPNILFQDSVENKRETKQDERVSDKNAHGLMPYLRDYSEAEPRRTKKQALGQTTTNKNARKQLDQVDEILELNPDAHTSAEAWLQMMADAYGTQDVPIAPYRFIEEINGTGAVDNLSRLSEGQIEDANHGFENAAAFREAYTSGKLGVETTAKLFLWSFLSRGVSPYTQEALFIDAFPGIDVWMDMASEGTLDMEGSSANFDLGDKSARDKLAQDILAAQTKTYKALKPAQRKKANAPTLTDWRVNDDGTVNLTYPEWVKTVAPAGSGQPGAGSTHNLNAFGKDFLVKMSQDVGDGTGRSRLQYLHDLMSDPESTGQQVRREFAAVGQGVGIDNKVVSFTLLVAGYNDVLVLDRVQFRQLYNDGRFDGVNIYDGFKEDGKVVTASGFSKQGDGARGILIYEAMERAVAGRVDEIYTELGREGEGSVGRYHWETWVADSQQEASHGSLGAILPAALGDNTAINKVSAKQGEYGSYAYGARYGVDGAGIGYFTYPTPNGNVWLFTIDQFVEFQQEVRKARNGVVPTKFKVTEAGNAPWYTSEEVNVENLDQLAERISSGQAGDGAGTLFQDGADQLISDRLPADPALEQQDPTQEVDFVGDVIFEVAPDPNNVELSARWNALPPAAQLAISDTVSKSVLPSVLEAAGAEGSVSPQIGSYLDDTNPSFSLRLTSGDPAAVANAVGFVLSQDSMVALSADAFEGSFEAGAVWVQIGDKSLQEIDAIYQTLRGIEGFPQIGGQSTTDGQMSLILEEGVDPSSFAAAVDTALASEYVVEDGTVHAAFPEKKDYDYASETSDPAGSAGEARQRYRDVRDQAAQEVAAAIDQYERGGQQPDLEQQRGATAAPRGGFTPSDLITDQDGNPVNLIQIFEKADPTTFLHESGHFWLEQLKADALAVGGGLQQDFKTVTDWWASRPLELREEAVKRAKKAKDKDSVAALQQMTEAQVSAYARSGELRGEGPSRYLSVAMHEQFARGVENYFATGRAPSLSLAGVFSAFKVWVGSVYAKLAGAKLDVQFSAEVTAVIDRMLAADEEIALIEGQYNLAAMYTTAEQAGMTPTQFAAYQKKIAEAKDDRRARQLAKHIKELKRERTAWWNDERETLRGETEQEVAAEPAYRLLYALTNQGLADGSTLPEGEALDRMDRELLKELLEAEGFSLDDIPRIDSKAVYEADGLSPGVVAQTFGYEDVDAMILDLVGRQPYAQAVDEAIDVKMEEEHGSIESSGETEALASAYSDKTAQVLAAELAALRTTEPAFKQAFVRAYARDRLLELPSAQIRPYRFLAAEKRHANMAGDALKRGDRVAAYQHQFQRLVNHYMATEALKAQRDIEKKTRYLKAFTKRGKKFPTIEADYVDNILRILAAVNFGQGAAGQQSRFNEIVALQAFIEEKQAADGSLLDVPAWLTDTSGSVANSTREISYLQFLQLHETIKRYEQQGRTANKIRRGDEELSLAEGKASLLSVLDGMNKSRVQRLRGKTASARGVSYTVASVIALADAQLLKVEALLEAIDGQVMGPWHQTIYEPFNQAAADKYRLQEEVSQVIGELISNLPKDVRRGFGKRVDVGALGTPGMTFTRGELIMMALNVGNESNLDKFIRGMGGDPETNVKGAGWNISEELIDAALDNLTEEEWSLVRGVWEHAEKLYPTVEGIYRREHGISPDRVEPRTVKTKFGEFKGGYFPMMYDRSIAGVAVDLQQKTALELMQAETGRASINSSMTKARTGYAAPVDLDISRLSIGLDNTIHFITHYGAVRNANKILGDRDIRAELETKVGIAYTEQLTKWVAALASNGNDSPPVDIFQKGIQQLYNNTTVGVLGFSYSTLGMQTLGLFNGQDRLLADSGYGPAGIAVLQKDMAEAVAAAFRPTHIEFVIQASGEMQGRRKSMDREVSQVLRNLTGKEGVVTAAQRFSMQAIAEVQFYTVDIPVWTAAYNRAQRGIVPSVNTGDTDAAIKYADRVVRMSQSAGGLKDLAAIQRHKGLIKGLTMFYSFFSALYFVLRSAGVEFTQNAKEKPIAATGRAATRLFVLLALQSVATGFIRGDLPDWDEEDEKKKSMLEYLAKESVSTALGTIPVVREIAAGWANGYGYSGGAGTIAFDAATKAMAGMEKFINELGEEETIKTDGDYEDLARRAAPYVLLLGALIGVPAVQANRTLDGLGAMYDEADNWYWSDLLRGYNAERAKRRED